MPRPSKGRLSALRGDALLAVADPVEDRLLIMFERLIRFANSDTTRRDLMEMARFPIDDVSSFLAINQLALHGAMRPTDLANRLETGRPNATKIIQRLEAAGLVTRGAASEDGRGVVIALSPAGRQIATRILRAERTRFLERVASLSQSDLANLERILLNFIE